jgi:hypothetical protein
MIGDGRIPRLNWPKCLAESIHSGRWIENYFCPIQCVHHPILRVVPAIANVHGNFAFKKLGKSNGFLA